MCLYLGVRVRRAHVMNGLLNTSKSRSHFWVTFGVTSLTRLNLLELFGERNKPRRNVFKLLKNFKETLHTFHFATTFFKLHINDIFGRKLFHLEVLLFMFVIYYRCCWTKRYICCILRCKRQLRRFLYCRGTPRAAKYR